MFGLAHVLIPRRFESLQVELDSTLVPFRRGAKEDLPHEKLAFDGVTDGLVQLYRSKFWHDNGGRFTWEGNHGGTYYLSTKALGEHLKARRLERFEGMLAEIEPDFETFVDNFTNAVRDPSTGRYGRWLNPIGFWDWWDLGGRFNGAIVGERRPADGASSISSGSNKGRKIPGNIFAALGKDESDGTAEIEANVELVETLRSALQSEERRFPTAIVLPAGCCADEYRWLENIEWHPISSGTRAFLGALADADFKTLVGAAYERFSDHAAAGVAYHF
jgi:hypothetical protein